MNFPIFLLLGFLPTVVDSFQCPNGSIQISSETVCIYAFNEPRYYVEAVRICASVGGLPIKIQNIFENTFTFAFIGQYLGGSVPYIGVERNETGNWTYADRTPLTYTNWALGEPNDSSTNACAVMNPQSGTWLAGECTNARPFFCSIEGNDFQCPPGWTYWVNNKSNADACYYVQDFTFTDGFHWQLYNWTSAEANCARLDAHLASIHSPEEDDFIGGLIKSNVKNQTGVAPDNNTCAYQWAWIGYQGNGTLGTGTWTDGSRVDYFGGYPAHDVYWWSMSNDASCNENYWSWGSQSSQFARFVCKTPPRSRLTNMI